jgi:hypothetical protein
LASDFAHKYSRFMQATMQSNKVGQKECSESEPEKRLSSRAGQVAHLTSALFFDSSKRCRKRPVIVLFCENDLFSRGLLSTAQALKFRLAPNSAHLFYLIRRHTWQ